ncbi:MAG: PEP-CTERM sorting domain-containing protein, partial [Planctomycetaceae bacterium]|nr:PEP-CTERM sorting domain-containing protein [Planctomycetaceae bacterium]
FGVVNVGDTFVTSGLLVDAVTLTPGGLAVPEPRSVVLLGISTLALLGYCLAHRRPRTAAAGRISGTLPN